MADEDPLTQISQDDNEDEQSERTLIAKELANENPACCDSCWACLLNDYLEDDLILGPDSDSSADKESEEYRSVDLVLSSSRRKDKKKRKKKKKKKSESGKFKSSKSLPEEPSITDEGTDLSNMFIPGVDDPPNSSELDPEAFGFVDDNVVVDRYQRDPTEAISSSHILNDNLSLEVKPSDPDGDRLTDRLLKKKKKKKKRSSSKRRPDRFEALHDDGSEAKQSSIPSDIGVLPSSSSTANSRAPLEAELAMAEPDMLIDLDDNKATFSRPRSRSRRREHRANLWDDVIEGLDEDIELPQESRSPEGPRIEDNEERSTRSRRSRRSRSRARRYDLSDELDLRDPATTRDSLDYLESKRRPSDRARDTSPHVLDLQLVPNRTGGDGTVDFPIEIPSNPSQVYHDGQNEELTAELLYSRTDKYDSPRQTRLSSRYDDKGRPRRSRRKSNHKYHSESRAIDLDVDDAVVKMLYADLPKRDKETRRLDRNSALERIRAIKNRIASTS